MSGLVLHFEVTCIELLPAEEGCQGAEFKTVNLAAGSLVAPVLAAFWKFFQSA